MAVVPLGCVPRPPYVGYAWWSWLAAGRMRQSSTRCQVQAMRGGRGCCAGAGTPPGGACTFFIVRAAGLADQQASFRRLTRLGRPSAAVTTAVRGLQGLLGGGEGDHAIEDGHTQPPQHPRGRQSPPCVGPPEPCGDQRRGREADGPGRV